MDATHNPDLYYYIDQAGARYGPAGVSQLMQWTAEGRITPDSQVENTRTGQRMPLRSVPGYVAIQQPYSTQGPSQSSYPFGSRYAEGYPRYPAGRIENNLAKAIIVTLCCCTPLGIVSIVYSAQVDGLARRGDYALASSYSQKANAWANWAIGCGLVGVVLEILVQALAASVRH